MFGSNYFGHPYFGQGYAQTVGALVEWKRSPLLADAVARAEHIPIFADAWQQPKEPPDG